MLTLGQSLALITLLYIIEQITYSGVSITKVSILKKKKESGFSFCFLALKHIARFIRFRTISIYLKPKSQLVICAFTGVLWAAFNVNLAKHASASYEWKTHRKGPMFFELRTVPVLHAQQLRFPCDI